MECSAVLPHCGVQETSGSTLQLELWQNYEMSYGKNRARGASSCRLESGLARNSFFICGQCNTGGRAASRLQLRHIPYPLPYPLRVYSTYIIYSYQVPGIIYAYPNRPGCLVLGCVDAVIVEYLGHVFHLSPNNRLYTISSRLVFVGACQGLLWP